MIRKLLLPALAVAMLGGCVSSGYQYRSGYGDYYYSQPRVEYRDYGSPYGGFGYGYPGGWSGTFGFGYGYGGYGFPYGYYGGYYDPYRYYYPWRPPHHHHDHHPGDDGHDGHDGPPIGQRDDGDRPPPWHDIAHPPRRPGGTPGITTPIPQQRPDFAIPSPRPPMPRSHDEPVDVGHIQERREPIQERREPDRDLRRKHEP